MDWFNWFTNLDRRIDYYVSQLEQEALNILDDLYLKINDMGLGSRDVLFSKGSFVYGNIKIGSLKDIKNLIYTIRNPGYFSTVENRKNFALQVINLSEFVDQEVKRVVDTPSVSYTRDYD